MVLSKGVHQLIDINTNIYFLPNAFKSKKQILYVRCESNMFLCLPRGNVSIVVPISVNRDILVKGIPPTKL